MASKTDIKPRRPGSPKARAVARADVTSDEPLYLQVLRALKDEIVSGVFPMGSGILGRHPVSPLTVHFSGAHTGYGPIIPGSSGLSYFTFRASADETGAQYLPAASARMQKGQRRNLVARHLPVSSPASMATRQQNAIDIGLEADDGLSVQLLRIAPDDSLQLPDFSSGAGVSMLVAAGQIVFDGRHYGIWSCLYARQDETSPEVAAGADGAEVLFLRYPRSALTS